MHKFIFISDCESEYAYDFEYPGGEEVTVPEGETCHGVCEKRENCETWTWTKDQKCKLQTEVLEEQPKAGAIAGGKRACRPRKFRLFKKFYRIFLLIYVDFLKDFFVCQCVTR